MNHLQLFENFGDDDDDYRGDRIREIQKRCLSYIDPVLSFSHDGHDFVDVPPQEVYAYLEEQPNTVRTFLIKPSVREKNPADETPILLRPLEAKGKKLKDPVFYLKSQTGGVYATYTWEEMIKNYRSWVGSGMAMNRVERKLAEYDVYGKSGGGRVKKPAHLNGRYDHPSKIPQEVYNLASKQTLLYSDATDAIRWYRIMDTEDEARYGNETMTFYRAVVGYDNIRPGDWITTERSYAVDHNERWLGGKGNIVEMEINGLDVLQSPTGNWEEAIYAPREFSKPYEYYRKGKKRD